MQEADWEENNARAYLYWTPKSWLALGAQYAFERFDRAEVFNAGIRELDTHTVPLSLSVFHASGLSGNLKTTFYDQSGVFQNPTTISGGDRFWLVDASLDYRLPKRRGLVRVGAKNLFDTSFRFQDTDPLNPRIQPERLVFAKLTINFD